MNHAPGTATADPERLAPPDLAASLTCEAGPGKGCLVASIVCRGGAQAAMMPASVDYWTPPGWLIPWISRTHVVVYKLSRGRIGGRVDGMPCILLRTIGRRSGKPHTVCLSYLPDGESMVIVGSYGGADRHPAWYHNLRANPEVIVQDRGRVFTATAETLVGAEREAVWKERIAGAPRYAHYQERTDREIPLVRLS